jgi:hypothetical protein
METLEKIKTLVEELTTDTTKFLAVDGVAAALITEGLLCTIEKKVTVTEGIGAASQHIGYVLTVLRV